MPGYQGRAGPPYGDGLTRPPGLWAVSDVESGLREPRAQRGDEHVARAQAHGGELEVRLQNGIEISEPALIDR